MINNSHVLIVFPVPIFPRSLFQGTGEEHRAIPTRLADWPDRFDRAPGPPGPGPVGPVGPVGPAGHLFS